MFVHISHYHLVFISCFQTVTLFENTVPLIEMNQQVRLQQHRRATFSTTQGDAIQQAAAVVSHVYYLEP